MRIVKAVCHLTDLQIDIIVRNTHTYTEHAHDFHKADKFRQLFKMGTTTHASTLRSDSYTGHIEAAGAIALIRVSHTTHVRTLDPTHTHIRNWRRMWFVPFLKLIRTEGVFESNTANQKW